MPCYIDEIGKTLITDCNECSLSYNPEFIAQGEIIKGFRNPDIILVGTDTDKLTLVLTEVYSKMSNNKPKFCFMKPIEAEIVKISFANMISDLCDNLNASKDVVLGAIGGKKLLLMIILKLLTRLRKSMVIFLITRRDYNCSGLTFY